MGAEKISHVGIVVPNLDEAIRDYSAILGIESVEREDVTSEGVKVAFLKIGDSEIELLCPENLSSGSVAKFMKERGPGIHHIAVKVSNVALAIEDAKAKGFKLVDTVPRKGARGAEAAFVHPKSLNGVLLEFYSM
jgi:methylmalonyl-CoA/ethylmalonyl-CoA epimerase